MPDGPGTDRPDGVDETLADASAGGGATLTRRAFVGLAAGTAAGLGLGLSAWGVGRRLPRVEERVLRFEGLAPAFDGFRILLLSDVHAGAEMDRRRMDAVVRHVDSLDADLVIIAGDMVDRKATEEDIRAFAASFGALRPPYGVVAVPGNHDHYAGIGSVIRELDDASPTLLRGDCQVIERSGAGLVLLGVDDPGGLVFDPPQDAAVAAVRDRAPAGAFAILVAHRPAAFDAAERLSIPLTLSGHTHGGQIALPLRDLTPVRAMTRYVRGHYRRNGSHLIVSSGVGTGGLPLRLGVPPSVALLTLRSFA